MDKVGVKRDVTTLKNKIRKFTNRNKNLILTCSLVVNIIVIVVASILLSDTRYTFTTGYIDAEDTIVTEDGNVWVTDISYLSSNTVFVGDKVNITFNNMGTDSIEDDEVVCISNFEN